MSQKVNLVKEEMDFFHYFHEANGKPKALNSIYVPITENPPQPSKSKSEQEVQAREQLSVLESVQSMDSNRRRESTKKAAPSSERLTMTKKSTLIASSDEQVAQNSAIQAKNKDEEEIRYENGMDSIQNGFVYFKGFAINNWIIIWLSREGSSKKFIYNHLTALLESAKSQGIPLGMPFKCYVFSLTGDENKLAQETKERIVQVLTTSSRKKVQLAMMYAPNNVDLEELTAAVKPVNNFRIITGYSIANYGLWNSLRSFLEDHKKLPVIGIATRFHDGQFMIARCQNQPKTGAKFDEPSFHRFKLAIASDNQFSEQLVCIVWNYVKNKDLDELVIYRSDASTSSRPLLYHKEVSDVQKLMEQSKIRFTYIVFSDIMSGSNQPTFEKMFDTIGFSDVKMTQLTAEVSFNSEKKGIPTPLAKAQMCVTRMIDHYNGFKNNENYYQVAQVKQGLDKEAYKVVETYFKS